MGCAPDAASCRRKAVCLIVLGRAVVVKQRRCCRRPEQVVRFGGRGDRAQSVLANPITMPPLRGSRMAGSAVVLGGVRDCLLRHTECADYLFSALVGYEDAHGAVREGEAAGAGRWGAVEVGIDVVGGGGGGVQQEAP